MKLDDLGWKGPDESEAEQMNPLGPNADHGPVRQSNRYSFWMNPGGKAAFSCKRAALKLFLSNQSLVKVQLHLAILRLRIEPRFCS